MQNLVDKLLCEHLITLKPYESARRLFSGGQDWLNANESPFSHPYTLDASRLNRYPACQPEPLVERYAAYAQLDPAQVLVTRGADEGIELLIRTFCTPGRDKVLICPPTYGMYGISAQTCNVGIEKAPLLTDFSLDLPSIFAYKGKVKLIFICSPNNPTGTAVSGDQVRQVIEHFADSALVVVDEAYMEFAREQPWSKQLEHYPNLVLLRTLSKAFALAGLRCGFTLADKTVIKALSKVIAPYPVPEPVAQIAEQALSNEGVARMRSQVAELNDEKARIKQALRAFTQITLIGDDKGNFLLFRCAQSQTLMQALVAAGILIRDQSKQLGLDNCLRISVGHKQQNDRLLKEIRRFFAQQENTL